MLVVFIYQCSPGKVFWDPNFKEDSPILLSIYLSIGNVFYLTYVRLRDVWQGLWQALSLKLQQLHSSSTCSFRGSYSFFFDVPGLMFGSHRLCQDWIGCLVLFLINLLGYSFYFYKNLIFKLSFYFTLKNIYINHASNFIEKAREEGTGLLLCSQASSHLKFKRLYFSYRYRLICISKPCPPQNIGEGCPSSSRG